MTEALVGMAASGGLALCGEQCGEPSVTVLGVVLFVAIVLALAFG